MYTRVYVDEAYHGEMKANAASDVDGYQYNVNDLNSAQTYNVTVKVCSIQLRFWYIMELRLSV